MYCVYWYLGNISKTWCGSEVQSSIWINARSPQRSSTYVLASTYYHWPILWSIWDAMIGPWCWPHKMCLSIVQLDNISEACYMLAYCLYWHLGNPRALRVWNIVFCLNNCARYSERLNIRSSIQVLQLAFFCQAFEIQREACSPGIINYACILSSLVPRQHTTYLKLAAASLEYDVPSK